MIKKSDAKQKIRLSANILFSGIGAQERGFENSGLFDIDLQCTSDICKESVLSYAAIHCGLTDEVVENYDDYPSREQMAQELTEINLGYDPDKNKRFDWFKLVKRKSNDLEKYWLANKLSKNLGDISTIEKLPYADLWTTSFPCTDISVAGKMKGLSPDSETRSSLLWDSINLLKTAKDNNELPKYILFENVKNLVSKKFRPDFDNLIEVLSELGFNTYWKVLNGKECGVPQNRERVFVVAIRKDIDTGFMDFPTPFDNGLRLKALLEDEVDKKYYLSDKVQERFKVTDPTFTNNIIGTTKPRCRTIGQRDLVYQHNAIMGSLVATDYKPPKQILQIGQLYGTENEPNPQAGRVYSGDGLSPTLDSCSGGNRMPKVVASGQFRPKDRNYNAHGTQRIEQFETRKDNISNAILTNAIKNCIQTDYRIRKLTPKECWRLMCFEDADADVVKNIGISDSAMYKQAGNSIITNCVELIAEHLYKAQYDNTYVCYDEVAENFTQPPMSQN